MSNNAQVSRSYSLARDHLEAPCSTDRPKSISPGHQHSAHLRNLAGANMLEDFRCHCQLKFSAIFAGGLGLAIGENPEQLHVRSSILEPLKSCKLVCNAVFPYWCSYVDFNL